MENDRLVQEYPIHFRNLSGGVMSIQNVDGRYLIMAVYGRLLRFDKTTGQVSEILYNKKRIPAIAFYREPSGIIWITTSNGIYTLRGGRACYEAKLNKVLSDQVTNSVRIDDEGKLWVGTIEHGLYVFDRSHRLVRHFSQSKSFFSNSVMHMYKGTHNHLWLATSEGVGLFTNMLSSYDFKIYGYEQGLDDPFIRAIREDKNGNVWVSTNNGLSYLNAKTHFFSNFNQNDGLPSNNITGGMHIFPDGKAYITSLDGIITFNVYQLTKKCHPSDIHFVRCSVLDATVENVGELILEPSRNQVVHLNHDQNDIRIVFAVANKAQCKQVDYSYMVDNLVEEWTMTDENSITFRSLSPGKYTIRVRARLHGQSWKEAKETSMSLVIAQPWWWTFVARFIYLCVLALAIYLYFQRYKYHLQIKNDLELERRKNNVEKAYYQERMQFFTNIAHEIRTPLTLIFSPLEVLRQSSSLQDEDLYHVCIIQKNVQRLMELINRLMEFRKAETNNLQLIVSKGDLRQSVRDIGNLFKDANHNADVHLLIDVEENSPLIYFDKNMMKSILSNLLNNAVKYTQKGTIGISLAQTTKDNHQYSCVKVWDTGCGIDKDSLVHIFERYYQVNSVHQASGTGIGLALVKKLCLKHKILIQVESEVGVGTTFTLLLDNTETYQEALHQESTECCLHDTPVDKVGNDDMLECHSRKNRPVVLVVEDNYDINSYIAHSLKDDYYVFQAVNGEEGFRLAKEKTPEIIISDIMMPVMDGFTMLKQLKADIDTCHIPVIMLTAKNSTEDQQKCYEYGVNSFITKPFSVNLLRTRIVNLLDSRKTVADYILQKIKSKGRFVDEKDSLSKLSVLDQKFLDKINQIIKENIASEKLTLVMLAEQLKVSQSTLYRKMKALTGVSGNEYIRKMRLSQSLQLMQEEGKNISEAAYESGFVDLAYFRACFKEEFGDVPSAYLKK